MPTNVSTPIWRCDTCGARFDENHAAAVRCESAPVPVELPAGTPLLWTRDDHFLLMPLRPTDRIETVATWTDRSGHHRLYTAGDSHNQWSVSDKRLRPGRPGHLQVDVERGARVYAGDGAAALDLLAMCATVGLGQPGSLASGGGKAPRSFEHFSEAHRVRPITDDVRAVFDLLGAHLPDRRYNTWQIESQRREYALDLAGGDVNRARIILAATPETDLDAQIANLHVAWFAGAAVTAPRPRLAARSSMTASKLTKAARAVIDATGVAWPARTSAAEYVNILITEKLMDTTHATTRLFGGATVIAVGGVKGGVGKSTVAAALARALADVGHRTTLVDLDLDGPSQHLLWDLGDVAVDDTLTRLVPSTVAPNLRVFSHGQIARGLPDRWTGPAATAWLTFIGSTLDTGADEIVVLDLPAGLGAVPQAVLDSSSRTSPVALVSVTTADPLALADAERGLHRQLHEKHELLVVENASTVTGTAADGSAVTVRLHGADGDVAAMAERSRARFAGSLPWAANHHALAATQEARALADALPLPTKVAAGAAAR